MNRTLLPIVLAGGLSASPAAACTPPAGFRLDGPAPVIAPADQLVSRTERIVLDRSARIVHQALDGAALEDLLPKPGDLPSVVATRALTPGGFGPAGSRRLVCLSDGSVILEQVVARQANGLFRYVVWNYTSDSARAVRYGVGEFRYTALEGGRTRIDWTYSFKLDETRIPGALGPLAAPVFRLVFLDRAYAALMRDTLAIMKTYVEGRTPAGG